ncbi:hypothetical protein DENIS_5162 [Desulfonema ishimotonii]|uniref:Nudix hydrolase domain-containing protein n=2 Tax=Desulfonema ishimotonii TaxID=45657 RepID=A0A401G4K4_9BACT|nr:hypothetical protein DENIS_5162 [Desulfonema ishimotonii]
MHHQKDTHCSYCGAPFVPAMPWPRTCTDCGRISYLNPLPVAVILVPAGDGLIFIRRGIGPGKGKLALPGGFIDRGESWQEAGAREVWEETGVRVDPQEIRQFGVRSSPDGFLLTFGLAAPVSPEALSPFHGTDETSERVILNRPPEIPAFQLHADMAAKYFRQPAGSRPLVGVGVMVFRDGKVLLGKRKNAHGAGAWQFPGGHLEFGESPEACARREVFEETGLRIRNVRTGPYTNDIFAADRKHYITLFVIAEYASGDVALREPDKCEEWGWFEWDHLPEPSFLPIRNLLRQGFAHPNR